MEEALPELRLDASPDGQQAIREAGLSGRVVEHGRTVEALLERLADIVIEEVQPVAAEVASIHAQASRAAADRLATAPRISHARHHPGVIA